MILRAIRWLALAIVIAVVAAATWIAVSPPLLFRVGTAYTAKMVCSNVALARRDPAEVLAVDVQAPGHPLLRLMRVDVDTQSGDTTAALLGFIARSIAVTRPNAGCVSVPDGDITRARAMPAAPVAPGPDAVAVWPVGERMEAEANARLDKVLADDAFAGPGMRAIVVVKGGHVVAERYGQGFSASTPLLGWSMTKTVTAAIVGTLVKDGKLSVEDTSLFPQWQGDGRRDIRIADMLAMASGLAFNEEYGDVTDVTSMLFLEPDMAAYAASMPAAAKPGERFNYSSGASLMVSRLWQNAAGSQAAAVAWPRERLFGPLGMTSAVLEADEAGTYAGSSYLYATARDWARFGQFLLNDGVWQGARLLPEGFVAWMREPVAASDGVYGRGHLWLRSPGPGAKDGLPRDAFWLEGHDGQSVAVIPSLDLVVVRMGLTPSKLGYSPQPLVEAIVAVRFLE